MMMFVHDEDIAALEAALPSLRDITHVEILVQLSWHLRQRDTRKSIAVCEEVETLLEHTDPSSIECRRAHARLCLVRGEAKWLMGELYAAEQLAQKSLMAFESLDDHIGRADAHWLLASIACDQNNIASSMAEFAFVAQISHTIDPVRVNAAKAASANLSCSFNHDRPKAHWKKYLRNLGSTQDTGLAALIDEFRCTVAFSKGNFIEAAENGASAYNGAILTGQIRRAIVVTRKISCSFYRINDFCAGNEWLQRGIKLERDTGWHPIQDSGINPGKNDLQNRDLEIECEQHIHKGNQHDLGHLLVNAKHDLSQPMHAMSLYLGALLNTNLPKPAQALVANIMQCMNAMDSIYTSLLDLSRLSMQMVKPRIEAFPIAFVLARISQKFAAQAREKGLIFRMVSSSAWVRSDSAIVGKILHYFAANAVQFTTSGKILMGCRRKKRHLRIAMHVTSEMPTSWLGESEQEHTGALQPGQHTRDVNLGLEVAQHLARLLPATLVLESKSKQSIMFCIELPLSEEPFPPASPVYMADLPEDILNGKQIIVIDDEPTVLDAVCALLEREGCSVVTATSLHEAFMKLSSATHPPDALICDYHLQENGNGIDAIKALRAEFNLTVPALLVTGDRSISSFEPSPETRLRVLCKPVHADVLRAALMQLLI